MTLYSIDIHRALLKRMRSRAACTLAFLSVLFIFMGSAAQAQTADPVLNNTPTPLSGSVTTRCGTGTLTYSTSAPAGNTGLALFTAGTYPPSSDAASVTPASSGILYDFGTTATAISLSTTGTTTAITGGCTGAACSGTTAAVRNVGSSTTAITVQPTGGINATPHLEIQSGTTAAAGNRKFILSGLPTGTVFYTSFKYSVSATGANTGSFIVGLGNGSGTSFSSGSNTVATTDFFTGFTINPVTPAHLVNAAAAVTTPALAANTAFTVEIYGNTTASTIYYKRGTNMYYLASGRNDVWINGTLTVTTGDEVAAYTSTVAVNALVIANNVASTVNSTLTVDDIRYIAAIPFSTPLAITSNTATQLVTASITAGTTAQTVNYVLAGFTAGVNPTTPGTASPNGLAVSGTVNPAPLGALTNVTQMPICGAVSVTNLPTFTGTLPSGANALAIYDNAAALDGAAANYNVTIAGTAFTVTGLLALGNGLTASGFFQAAFVPTTNTTDIPRVLAAANIAPGCTSAFTPVTYTSTWSPTPQLTAAANFTIGTNNVTMPAAPIYGNTAGTVTDLARCGTGALTFTVGFNNSFGAIGTSSDLSVVQLYTQATGGTPVATSPTFDPSNSSTVPVVVTLTTIGTTTYYAQVSNAAGTCPNVAVTRVPLTATAIQVPGAPTVANATQTRCNNAAGTLTFTTTMGSPAGNEFAILNAAGTDLTLASAAASGSVQITGANFGLAAATSSTTNYMVARTRVTVPNTAVSVTACTSTVVPLTVNNVTTPTAPTVAVSTRCGDGLVTFTISAPSNATGASLFDATTNIQYGSSTTYVSSAAGFLITIPVTTANSGTVYTATYTVGGCASTATNTTLTVNAVPAAPTALVLSSTPPCSNNATLAFSGTMAAAAAAGTVNLYTVSTGGTPISAAAFAIAATTFSGLSAVHSVATTYYAEIVSSTGPCTSATRTALVVGAPSSVPAAPTAANISVCTNAATPVTITVTPSGTITNVQIYDAATAGALVAGAVGSGSAVAGQDATSPYEFTITSPAPGSVATYYVQSNNGGCASARTMVTISALQSITANLVAGDITSSIQRCGTGAVTFTISNTGTQPGSATQANAVRLFTASSGGTAISTDTGAPFVLTTSSLSATTLLYIEAYNTATGCSTAARTGVTFTVYDVPASPTSNGATFCGNASVTFTLTATFPTATSKIELYTVASNGTPVATYTTNVAATVNTVTLVPGQTITAPATVTGTATTLLTTTTYFMELINPTSVCTSARVQVVATQATAPATTTAANVSRCGSGDVTFTVSGTVPNPGGVQLVRVSDNAVITTDVSSPYELSVSGLAATTSYYLRIFSNSSACTTSTSTTSPIIATVNTVPTALTATPTVVPANTCGSTNVTMVVPTTTVSSPASGVRLYTVATGGTSVANATVPTNVAPATTLSYLLTTTTPITTSMVMYVVPFDASTGCEATTRTPVTVSIISGITAPSVSPIARCGAGTVTLTVSANTTGTEARIYTQATFNSAVSPLQADQTAPFEFTITGLTATTTYYVASALGSFPNGCESSRVPVVITINDVPATPALTSASKRCGYGTVVFTVNPNTVPAGLEARLYVVDRTATDITNSTSLGIATSADNLAPFELTTGLLSTTTNYFIAAYNASTGCESPRASVTATINTAPAKPGASDVSRCGNGAVTFTATTGTPAGNVARLYTQQTVGLTTTTMLINTDNASPYELATPVLTTTTSFWVAMYDEATECESERRTVIANVYSQPSDPTIAGVERCSTGTVVFSPMMGMTGGIQTRLYDAATGGNLLASNASAPFTLTSPVITTTTTFYVEIFTPGLTNCASSTRVAVTATVNENPSAPTSVSTPISVCGPGQVTISGQLAAPANTLVAYNASIGGSVVGSDSRATGPYYVTVDANATTAFYVAGRSSITGCESSRVPVTVIVSGNNRPSAPVITNLTGSLICGGGSANIIAAMGVIPGNTMRLYTVPMGGTATAEVTASPFQFSVTPSANQEYYVAAYNSTSACEGPRTKVTVVVGTQLNAPSASTASQTRCGAGSATFTISSNNNPNGNVIRLYTAATGGNAVASFNPTVNGTVTEFYVTTPSASATTTFYASAYDSFTGCEGTARTTLTVTVNAVPETPFSSDVIRCNAGIVTFTATMGTTTPGDVMRMYTVPSGGTPILTDNTSPYELATLNLGVGQYPYFLSSYNSTTNCESVRLAVVATVNTGIVAPTVPTANSAGCGSGLVMFNPSLGSPLPTMGVGSVLRLYAASTGGSAIAEDATAPFWLSSPVINATGTYYISSYDPQSMCESSRVPAIATVVASAPSAPAGANLSQCVNGAGNYTFTAMMGSITGIEMRLYTSEVGGTPVQTDETYPYNFTVSASSDMAYYIAMGTGTCEGTRTKVTATVYQTPSTPSVSTITRCGAGTVQFSVTPGSTPGTRAVLYDAATGGNMVDMDNTLPFNLSANVSGNTNYFVAIETDNCASTRALASANVINNQNPVHSFMSTNIAVCPGARGMFVGNLNGYGNELRMYNAPVGGNVVAIANPIINNTTPFPLWTPALSGTSNFFVAAYDPSTGCETNRLTVTASVGNPGGPIPATTTQTVCGAGSVTFEVSPTTPTGSIALLYTLPVGGSPVATDDMPPYTLTTPSLANPSTTFYASFGANGGCESARVPVVAVLQAGPSLPFAPDVARCGNGVAIFTANMGATPGNSIRMYDAAMGGNLINEAFSFPYELATGFLTTTSEFYLSVKNPTCETDRVRVRASIGGSPSTPVPVANVISLCGSGSVNFVVNQGPTPGADIRLYTSAVGGQPIAVDNTFPYEVKTPTISGTTTYFVSSGIGNCESPRTQVIALAATTPSLPIVNNVTRCGAGPVVFTASNGAIGGTEMRLYSQSSGGQPWMVDNTAPFELMTPSLAFNTTFFVSTASGNCESPRVPVTAIIAPALTAPFVQDVSICGGGAATFNASVFGSNEVRLYTSPNGGIPVSVANAAPYTVTTAPLTVTTTFFVAASNGTCESNRVPAVANVLLGSVPSAPSAMNVTRCGPGPVEIPAMMGTNPGTEMRLYTAITGGILITSTARSPFVLSVPTILTNTTYYLASATGGCESGRTAVAVSISNGPAMPAVNNVAICGATSGSATLTVTFSAPSTGLVVRLYNVPTGGTALATASAAPYLLNTPSVNFPTTFYVGASNGTCEGARVPAIVSFASTPSMPMANNVNVCSSGGAVITAAFGTAQGTEIRLYPSATGGSPILVDNSAPFEFSVNVNNVATYYLASAFSGNCESGRTPVIVSVTGTPAITLQSITPVTCDALGSIRISSTTSGMTYRLNGVGAGNTVGQFDNLESGSYFVEGVSSTGCKATISNLVVSATAGPASVTVTPGANTATVKWTPIAGLLGYNLRYRISGINADYVAINNLPVTAVSQILSGLQSGSNYEVQVQGICPSGRLTSFTGAMFTTTQQQGIGNCVTPLNVSATSIGSNAARIAWTPNATGATCYVVTYGIQGTDESGWSQFLVAHPASSFDATNLISGRTYTTRVRTNCTECTFRGSNMTPFSAPTSFVPGGNTREEIAPSTELSVYPNPTSGSFSVKFESIVEAPATVVVTDLAGRVLFNQTSKVNAGINEIPVDITGVASGMYLINFKQGAVNTTTRVIVN